MSIMCKNHLWYRVLGCIDLQRRDSSKLPIILWLVLCFIVKSAFYPARFPFECEMARLLRTQKPIPTLESRSLHIRSRSRTRKRWNYRVACLLTCWSPQWLYTSSKITLRWYSFVLLKSVIGTRTVQYDYYRTTHRQTLYSIFDCNVVVLIYEESIAVSQ